MQMRMFFFILILMCSSYRWFKRKFLEVLHQCWCLTRRRRRYRGQTTHSLVWQVPSSQGEGVCMCVCLSVFYTHAPNERLASPWSNTHHAHNAITFAICVSIAVIVLRVLRAGVFSEQDMGGDWRVWDWWWLAEAGHGREAVWGRYG